MITHAEAQALLSERLDAPLDPYVDDILEAHLATCDQCRAFAESSAYLAHSLHTMPFMPASAAVRQNVWAAIEQQQHSWWRRFLAAMTGQTAAVVSTAAVALIVIAFASVAILRLVDTGDGDGDNEARLAAGTQENIALATESAEPTEPDVATTQQAEATDIAPSPTPTETATANNEAGLASTSEASTDSVEPTATSQPSEVPTDVPAPTEPPTETEVPPTAAPRETEVQAERFAPTAEPDNDPTDLTGRGGASSSPGSESAVDNLEVLDPAGLLATVESTLDTPVPSPTTEPPTETPVPATDTPEPSPTATSAPPTETPAPPTQTPSPTAVPSTSTPSPAPSPTATAESSTETPPPIEPIDGSTVIDTSRAVATETPSGPETTGDDDGSDDTIEQIIEAAGSDEPTSEDGGDISGTEGDSTDASSTDSPLIGPPDAPRSSEGRIESTTDNEQAPAATPDDITGEETSNAGTTEAEASGEFNLSDAPFYSDGSLWGSPDARLGYQDGVVIFSGNPDGYGLGRDDVEVQTVASENGDSIAICANGDCTDATSESADGPHTDEPIGWVDGRLIYQRISIGQPIEIRAVVWNGEPVDDEQLGTIDEPVSPLGFAYPVSGGTLVPTSSSWLLISDNSARVVDSNPYGEVRLVRTNYGDSDLITYVANGQVIVASTASPGSPVSTIPFSGVDYDLSTRAQAVAVSTGSGIEIYDLGGSLLAASDTSIETGSLLWLQDGIVFIDQTNNKIRLVDPEALDL